MAISALALHLAGDASRCLGRLDTLGQSGSDQVTTAVACGAGLDSSTATITGPVQIGSHPVYLRILLQRPRHISLQSVITFE